MKKYSHLTSTQRDILANELARNNSKKNIANLLNVHLSTIYREIKRNQTTLRNTHYKYYTTYLSSAAHTFYLQRRKNNSNSSKFTKDIKFIIEQGLKSGLSFSTICGLRHKTDKLFPSLILELTSSFLGFQTLHLYILSIFSHFVLPSSFL